MKKIKFLSLIILILGFYQCKSTKFDKTPPFSITGASYNNWVGGLPGVTGINVFIAYKADTNIVFDTIYFSKRAVKITPKKIKDKNYLIGYFNTSTVNSKNDLILNTNGKKEIDNKAQSNLKFPFELKENEAVISYQENGKTTYYKVKDIKQTKTDFYP